MMSQKEYHDILIDFRQEQRKFEDMAQQSLLGKTVVKILSCEFELLFDFRVMCTKLPAPSYMENLELGILVEEMKNL